MNRLAIFLIFLFVSFGASSQTLDIQLDIYDNSPAGLHPVWVTVAPNSGSVLQLMGDGGRFDTTITHPGAAVITYFTYDCGGNTISDFKNISPNDSLVADTLTAICIINANTTCVADFLANNSVFSTTVGFIDSSKFRAAPNTVTSYLWDFGDGSTSALRYPVHTYAAAGNYNVCLTITEVDSLLNTVVCSDTKCLTVSAGNPASCNAAFSTQTSPASLAVGFFDNSTVGGSPDSVDYSWSFGDGTGSGQKNPVHTYNSPGSYLACLTIYALDSVGNILCSDSSCVVVYVGTFPSLCTANFSSFQNPTTLTVNFNDSSNVPGTPSSILYNWDFGDGSTGVGKNTMHTYSQRGVYTVCLTINVLDSGLVVCTDSICKSLTVGLGTCNTTIDIQPGNNRYAYTFNHNSTTSSTLAYTSNICFYQFGDGNSATSTGNTGVNHTYANQGLYVACVTNYFLYGTDTVCSDTDCDTIEITAPFCQAEYIIDTANSFFGNVYIWNTSVPAYSDPAYSKSYSWDFGDGNTSVQPFPVHTYANPGLYQVCLTMRAIDNVGDTCVSTFCDSLGVDSAGNLIYKSINTGFTLNVLNPENIGLEENALTSTRIYPNPASDHLRVELLENRNISWQIIDLKGSVVLKGDPDEIRDFNIDVSLLTPGIYLLNLDGEESGPAYFKILIDR